jgi:ankyrin repeat protein
MIHLPDDMLKEIISQLSQFDAVRLSRTCKKLHQIVYSKYMQKKLLLPTDGSEVNIFHFAQSNAIMNLQNLIGFNLNCALQGAAAGGHALLVQQLVAKGADRLYDAFTTACLRGNLSVIKFLISKGMTEWDSGLHFSCMGGDLNLVNYFLDSGATDYNAGFLGSCIGGKITSAELMISKGADKFDQAIMTACRNGQLQLVKLIYEKLENPSRNRFEQLRKPTYLAPLYSLFTIACAHGHAAVVEYLLDQGLNSSYYNDGLQLACTNGKHDVINLLINRGATQCKCGLTLAQH